MIPTERMIANCTSDGNWNPDPSDLLCQNHSTITTNKSCNIPAFMLNVKLDTSVHLNTTYTEGSVIRFYCVESFIQNTTVTSICTSEGEWNPNPTNYNCQGMFN